MPSPHLERKAREVLGEDAGQELGDVIDRIDPIRGDIAELRLLLEKGFTAQRSEWSVAVEKAGHEQLRYFILAWGIQLAAIVGLYGTLIALTR